MDFFSQIRRDGMKEAGAIIHLNNTVILWYISGVKRIEDSSSDAATEGPQNTTRQTKQS